MAERCGYNGCSREVRPIGQLQLELGKLSTLALKDSLTDRALLHGLAARLTFELVGACETCAADMQRLVSSAALEGTGRLARA